MDLALWYRRHQGLEVIAYVSRTRPADNSSKQCISTGVPFLHFLGEAWSSFTSSVGPAGSQAQTLSDSWYLVACQVKKD
jgi:hypothetical protein